MIVEGIGHLIADTRAKTGRHIEGLRASADIERGIVEECARFADDPNMRVGSFSGIPFSVDPSLPHGTCIADLDPAI